MACYRNIVLMLALILTASGINAQPIPTNVQIPGNYQSQYEVQAWINETDSTNIVASWRDRVIGGSAISVGASTDAGATWNVQSFAVDLGGFDPCVVGNLSGTFFLTMIENTDLGIQLSVYRSTNLGQFWGAPQLASPPSFQTAPDKEFAATDRTGGPYAGNLYVSWTRYSYVDFGDSGRVMFSRSTDGGLTFGDTVTIAPLINTSSCGTGLNNAGWSIPIVNSDGSVHVFTAGVDIDSSSCTQVASIRQAVSTDGGATFGADKVAFHSDFQEAFIDGGVKVFGAPVGDADISGGVHDGTIYIAHTQTAASPTLDKDIEVRRSTDNGLTWSSPEIVNDDLPGQNIDQFQPWLIVNEEGVIMLSFYDQRNDPINHTQFDHYFAASFDGGETFTQNYRLSSASSTPGDDGIGGQASKVGEYEALDARHEFVFAAWTDRRGADRDIYSATFTLPFLRPRLYLPADETYMLSTLPSFEWSTCWHESQDTYRLEISTDPGFGTIDYSFGGLSDNSFTPGAPLGSATYHWRVKAFRSGGDSTEYSEAYTVVTGCGLGAAPSLSSPPVGDTVNSTTVLCDWNPTGDALAYRFQLSALSNFSSPIVDTALTSTQYGATGLSDVTTYYWRVNSTNPCGTGAWAQSNFYVLLCPITRTGDANIDGVITSADIIKLVNYTFKGGLPPQPCAAAGDVNCSGQVTSADIIGLVNYVFKGGTPPCDVCTMIPGTWSCP